MQTLLARRRNMPINPKFECKVTGVAPRNGHPDSNVLNSRQFTDAPRCFPVVLHLLSGLFSVMHHGHVHGEHVAGIEAGLHGLKRQKRFNGCSG